MAGIFYQPDDAATPLTPRPITNTDFCESETISKSRAAQRSFNVLNAASAQTIPKM